MSEMSGNGNLVLVLSEAIQNNKFADALAAVKGLRPVDLADILAELDLTSACRLLERLPKRAEVFTYFEAEQQVSLAREFPEQP